MRSRWFHGAVGKNHFHKKFNASDCKKERAETESEHSEDRSNARRGRPSVASGSKRISGAIANCTEKTLDIEKFSLIWKENYLNNNKNRIRKCIAFHLLQYKWYYCYLGNSFENILLLFSALYLVISQLLIGIYLKNCYSRK